MEGIWLFSYSILWLVVLVEAFLIFALYRQIGMLYLNSPQGRLMQGLRVGTKAPVFSLTALDGREIDLSRLRGRRVLLLFGSPACRPCRDLFPSLNHFYRTNRDQFELIFLSDGLVKDTQAFASINRVKVPMVPLADGRVSEQYEVRATPFAFMVDEHGVIAAKGAASSVELLKELIGRAKEAVGLASSDGAKEQVG